MDGEEARGRKWAVEPRGVVEKTRGGKQRDELEARRTRRHGDGELDI
jgi:hypothetical protein